jgi:hypothetical protein
MKPTLHGYTSGAETRAVNGAVAHGSSYRASSVSSVAKILLSQIFPGYISSIQNMYVCMYLFIFAVLGFELV